MSSSSSSLSACRRRRHGFQDTPLVDWTKLPYDLVASIANNLHSIEDFVSFSSVCHSWRLVYRSKDWTPSRRVPWLMVDEKYTSEVCIRRFMSVWKNTAYNISLPEAHNRRYWGSTLGWIVTVDQNLVIRLINPVSHVCFDLPPYSTLETSQLILQNKVDWFSAIRKAAVFKIRSVLVTMIIYGYDYRLAFYQHNGGSAWVTVPVDVRFVDVVCFENQTFALSTVGTLFRVEIDGHDRPRVIRVSSPLQDQDGLKPLRLVQSSEELLLIFLGPRGFVPRLKMYRFDFNAAIWTLLRSLGQRALFVDDSQSFSISGGEDFKANSIYFAIDSLERLWARNLNDKWNYCVVYHVEDQTFENFSVKMWYSGIAFPRFISPTWLIPTLS